MTQLPLKRVGQPVVSFLSGLGGVRETRLTATLGYLISRFPDEFSSFLGSVVGPASYISVEETSEGDRYDVLVADTYHRRKQDGRLPDGKEASA